MNQFSEIQDGLERQFGYTQFYGPETRSGWLLNYNAVRNTFSEIFVDMYFVDQQKANFKIRVPYYQSFLVGCGDEATDTEEYLLRRYEGKIQKIEQTTRIDVAEHNHLNKPPRRFLDVYVKTENDFAQIVRDLRPKEDRAEEDLYRDFALEDPFENLEIYEYDIPIDVRIANYFNVRCGAWYDVFYDGAEYRLAKNPQITFPELRVMAYDIETTKPPLKFPNPDHDSVMMISIMMDTIGELIINREVVAEDICEFEYEAKDDMKCQFKVSNEPNEEALLTRFIELIQTQSPHIITTYNGGFFDWPFVEKRAAKYGLHLENTVSFRGTHEYYESPFIMHLDCYKWVKRDSYLPMNNQGLKDAARIKLGYFPDEIDPEDMVRCAKEEPQKLASYSVSDAVATYFLYMKFVHSHIFSIASIIPLPTVQILCRGSGTLCEALLFSQAIEYNMLVPRKKRLGRLEYFNGHIVENLTYVGGHVESLQAGVFRSDFDHNFNIDDRAIDLIIRDLDCVLYEYVNDSSYLEAKARIVSSLDSCRGVSKRKGQIYHLDVGAMYPNIILTNRLQPTAIVSDDVCIHCDYNKPENDCKRSMPWVSRSEYLPPIKSEVEMIKHQLMSEAFYRWDGNTSKEEGGDSNGRKVPYAALPIAEQETILRERVAEYSKKIYKRAKKTETKAEELTVCQREVPFYVETVRKFRDQRNVLKGHYKAAMKEFERDPCDETCKKLVVYNSLQVAYKCVLNSFYGYVMRTGSRWFSLEMAAAVCDVGGRIIRLAREFVDMIGIPLELDTDGIWCCLPADFPTSATIGSKRIPLLASILNYFVCQRFTNEQYQVLGDNGYTKAPQNTIQFEADGPYKTMVIPASTEENRLLKKRYVVFDGDNRIAELKGFELKRRGELMIVKKFQEDLFKHFNDGTGLEECYSSLAAVANYWLDIIDKEGGSLDEEAIFELFSESRNMAKSPEGYGDRKTNILSTAKKLAQFLGEDVLEDKLKCEFIVSKYPENALTADRCIPVLIFRHKERDRYLRRWLGNGCTDLRKILDWAYYRRRFESILQRLIVVPAYFQGLRNPIERVEMPSWTRTRGKKKLAFDRVRDIEDVGMKPSLDSVFYTSKRVKASPVPMEDCAAVVVGDASVCSESSSAVKKIMEKYQKKWLDFFYKREFLIKMDYNEADGTYTLEYLNGERKTAPFVRRVLLEINEDEHFLDYKKAEYCFPGDSIPRAFRIMEVSEGELKTERYHRFFSHFAIKSLFNTEHSPLNQLVCENEAAALALEPLVVSSFQLQSKAIYCLSSPGIQFITEAPSSRFSGQFTGQLGKSVLFQASLEDHKKKLAGKYNVVVYNRGDGAEERIKQCFAGSLMIEVGFTNTVSLESIESILRKQCSLHLKMKERLHQLGDIAEMFNIPILNVKEDILDLAYFKEAFQAGMLCQSTDSFVQHVVRDELTKPGYYPSYCLQLECSGSLLLSVIESDCFLGGNSFGGFFKRREFQVLVGFLRKILIASLKGNQGAAVLVRKLAVWLKKESSFITPETREALGLLQQKYLAGLLGKLKDMQCKVVLVCKEMIILDTGKNDKEGAEMYLKYIRKKIAEIPGYELLSLRKVRVFEQLAFVDASCYFYLDGGCISSFSDTKLPLGFFNLYFSDTEISNDQVYELIPKLSVSQARLLLRILSYKRDTHGLASNCYKLLRVSEFKEDAKEQLNLTVFCDNCGFENFIRKKCISCYSEIAKEHLENECLAYLKHLWMQQAGGSRYCVSCGACEERKLKDYCRCGGRFTMKSQLEEIEELRKFVNTRRFDEEVEIVKKYFDF